VTLRMHQIRFSPGELAAEGTHDAPPESLIGWGERYFLPIPLPVDACGASLCLGGLLQRLGRIDAFE